MEINWNKDPCEESLPFTKFGERNPYKQLFGESNPYKQLFGERNPYKQFIQALYQFENIIIRIKTCRMNDREKTLFILFGSS